MIYRRLSALDAEQSARLRLEQREHHASSMSLH
jgi:hypothetical protein